MKSLKLYCSVMLMVFLVSCSARKTAVKTEEEDAARLIAQMVVANRGKLPNKSIAVIEFSDINGNPLPAGKLLAERIISRLAQYQDIKVVERSRVSRVLEEQKLGLSGLTDQATAKKLGRILNVDALLTGTVICVNDYTEINARMVDTESALVLSAKSVKTRDPAYACSPSSARPVSVTEKEKQPSARTPRVDVSEFRVEKDKEGLGKGYGTIKIYGKGIYTPSQEEPVAFRDLMGKPVFNLLDMNRNKIMEFGGGFKFGAYGNEENIKAGVPFPFEGEDGLVRKEIWDKVASCEFVKWQWVK